MAVFIQWGAGTEFYEAFVTPQMDGEDDAAVGLSRNDVSNDKLKGKGFKEVIVLYSRFLAHDPVFAQFITWIVFFNCIVRTTS